MDDAFDVLTLRYLIAFVINLAYSELGEKKAEALQMFITHTPFLQSAMGDLAIDQYGQFLLYTNESNTCLPMFLPMTATIYCKYQNKQASLLTFIKKDATITQFFRQWRLSERR